MQFQLGLASSMNRNVCLDDCDALLTMFPMQQTLQSMCIFLEEALLALETRIMSALDQRLATAMQSTVQPQIPQVTQPQGLPPVIATQAQHQMMPFWMAPPGYATSQHQGLTAQPIPQMVLMQRNLAT